MRKRISWTLLLGAALLMGCGKQMPKDVIQPDEMENILYDYHLSSAMSNDLSYNENYKKEFYKKYIFNKYKITEAQFDSSMVWYTRHTEELSRIYTKLGVRFRNEKKEVQKLLAMRDKKPETSMPGDTVDVWYDHTLYWLTDAPLSNKITFEIPTDSNFKEKDAFLWSADYVFLAKEGQTATMGFNILFDNDSVVGRVKEITYPGVQSLYLKPDSAYKIKSINGFIYYSGKQNAALGMIVNNISLTRYHEPVDTITTHISPSDSVLAAKDSMHVDSIVTTTEKDTVSSTAPSRLNPREMKENNANRPQRIRPRKL